MRLREGDRAEFVSLCEHDQHGRGVRQDGERFCAGCGLPVSEFERNFERLPARERLRRLVKVVKGL